MEDFPDDSGGKASVYNMGVGMLTCAGGGERKRSTNSIFLTKLCLLTK